MAGNSFDRTETLMGLSACQRLTHFAATSPFNYKENCLLYIPSDPPQAPMGSDQEDQGAGRTDMPSGGSDPWPHAGAVHVVFSHGDALQGGQGSAGLSAAGGLAACAGRHPAIQAGHQRCAVCGGFLLGRGGFSWRHGILPYHREVTLSGFPILSARRNGKHTPPCRSISGR